MSHLYIPPPGAMQFELTQGWDGTPCPDRLRPFVFWVMPLDSYGPKDSKPDCPHNRSYAVLRASLSPLHSKRGIGTCDKVCECVGRIIE